MPITSRFVVRSTALLFAVAFVALAIIVGANIWLSERSQAGFDLVVAARDVRSAAVEVQKSVQQAESAQRGFVFTGNPVYLAPYDPAKAQALKQFAFLKTALAAYTDLSAAVNRLSDVLTQKFSEMDQTISLKRARDDAGVQTIFRTNRGKALMDEANVFFTGVVLAADARITAAVNEERTNAGWLRLVAIVGGGIILLVVGAATFTIYRYTLEIRAARDQYANLNGELEKRVEVRTADLARARDRAEMLVTEVNHRVANSLTMVSSLVNLQSHAVKDAAAKEALDETQGRINAIALVHKRLYSAGEVKSVELSEYLAGVLSQFSDTAGTKVRIHQELSPMRLRTDASISLGVVLTEWLTNAVKYAYPDGTGDIWVRLAAETSGTTAELSVEDRGRGHDAGKPPQGTGLGTRIVRAMAQSMGATVEYLEARPGTRAQLRFPLEAQ